MNGILAIGTWLSWIGPPIGRVRTSWHLVVDRSTTGSNWVDEMETGRTEPHLKGSARPKSTKATTFCQGEGRGFESRLPLSKSRLLAGLMRIARLIEFTISAHHRPPLAHHGTRLERWMQPGVRFVSEGLISYELRVYAGTDPVSRRRRWLTRTVRGDRSDALRELKALAARANIAQAVGAHTTVTALLDQWFARGRSTWSPTTIRNLTDRRAPPQAGSW